MVRKTTPRWAIKCRSPWKGLLGDFMSSPPYLCFPRHSFFFSSFVISDIRNGTQEGEAVWDAGQGPGIVYIHGSPWVYVCRDGRCLPRRQECVWSLGEMRLTLFYIPWGEFLNLSSYVPKLGWGVGLPAYSLRNYCQLVHCPAHSLILMRMLPSIFLYSPLWPAGLVLSTAGCKVTSCLWAYVRHSSRACFWEGAPAPCISNIRACHLPNTWMWAVLAFLP